MHAAIDDDWYWLRQIYLSIEDPVQDWWALIILPAAIGLASLAVAFASVIAARSATDIAKKSESARVKAEKERTQVEAKRRAEDVARDYNFRLDETLVALFQAIGERFEDLEHWERDRASNAALVELNPGMSNLQRVLPSLHKVSVSIDAVRLVARGTDLSIVDEVAHAFDRIREDKVPPVVENFEDLVTAIRRWRNGSVTDEVATAQLMILGKAAPPSEVPL